MKTNVISTGKMGSYELLTLLASGGMAEIHLARRVGIQGFERLVVIKRIHPHLARISEFVEMFLDEARIAAGLSHPNIVQILDLGEEEGEYYIAMEYLEGESLGFLSVEGRATNNPVPQAVAASVIAQVCDGLEYAHTLLAPSGEPLNIVHRDVSPQNIIVLYSGLAKLVDFGIAKAANQMHRTMTGNVKGKLSYMAPEQCMGRTVDARTDVFSAGVVLWEMLTHQRLFKVENEANAVRAVLSQIIPSPRQVRSSVAAELASVCVRALNREPELRFQSAAEMGTAIRQALKSMGSLGEVDEIASYVKMILAGRDRIKKAVLLALEKQEETDLPLEVLKPHRTSAANQPTETLAKSSEASGQEPGRSARPGRSKSFRWLWPAGAGVAIAIAAILWIYLAGPSPGDIRHSDPVLEPQPVQPPAEAEMVVEPVGEPPRPDKIRRKTRRVGRTEGTLWLDTQPWSKIYLGERELGLTPLVDVKLSAGRHKLSAVNEVQGIRKDIIVQIRPGKKTQLKVDLKSAKLKSVVPR